MKRQKNAPVFKIMRTIIFLCWSDDRIS